MRFGWDARKSDQNLRERHFDFDFATQVFDGPTLEREDTRRDYGERGRERIRTHYSIEAIAAMYQDLYRRVGAGDPGPLPSRSSSSS